MARKGIPSSKEGFYRQLANPILKKGAEAGEFVQKDLDELQPDYRRRLGYDWCGDHVDVISEWVSDLREGSGLPELLQESIAAEKVSATQREQLIRLLGEVLDDFAR